mmetsp:Transcript_27397/g.78957  ORF Transcript_27397/g.78957 Transcript_27397/m.78957 type:complete len:581 (-) Transcript_27397:74-1816(-)
MPRETTEGKAHAPTASWCRGGSRGLRRLLPQPRLWLVVCLNTLLVAAPLARADRSASSKTSKAVLAVETGNAASSGHGAWHALLSCGNSAGCQSAAQALEAQTGFIPGFGMGRNALKMMAACFVCVLILRFLGKLDFSSKRWDCRRCKCIAKGLLKTGYDDFEGFDLMVTIHGVADIKKDGMFGDKEFKVKVNFNWSKWETSPTKDLKWEQTKGMEVPQGAGECNIALFTLGTLRDSRIAEYTLETKKDLLDKEDIWGQKQRLKMECKGKHVGTLTVTFRRKGGQGAPGDAGPAAAQISGVDEDSALMMELNKEMEALESKPGSTFKRPEKLEGEMKVGLLAQVLAGDLREITKKGKEAGKVYVKVLQCNVAELQGDEMMAESKRQWDKAKKKGLKQPEKKWYWCWYEDKKASEHKKKWHYPEGFIPIVSILKVNRSPERNDQFIITYGEEGSKEVMIYRRDTGKGLEVWVDGIELIFNECRRQVKDGKEDEAALTRMRQMHMQWLKRNGPPKNDEQWTKWFEWFKSNKYNEDLIKKLFQEITMQARAAQAQAAQAPQQAQQGARPQPGQASTVQVHGRR